MVNVSKCYFVVRLYTKWYLFTNAMFIEKNWGIERVRVHTVNLHLYQTSGFNFILIKNNITRSLSFVPDLKGAIYGDVGLCKNKTLTKIVCFSLN